MNTHAFAALVHDNQVATVVHGIETAVAISLSEDRAPGRIVLVHGGPRVTGDELRRRVTLCVSIFRVLRGDLKWTVARCVDHLPAYLRKALDGENWEPEAKRASWFAHA